MSLSLQEWREKLKTGWNSWKEDPRGKLTSLGAGSLYLAVAGSTLYPVAAAIAHGDPAAGALLVSIAGGIGGKLIAELLQKGTDEKTLSQDLAQAADRRPQIIPALDAVLEKLDAIPQITSGMNDDDLAWFNETFHSERARLVSNTGSGAIAINGAVAAGKGGVAVGGSVHGNINIGVANSKDPED